MNVLVLNSGSSTLRFQIIDTDLQDPPELIPEMIETWRAGYDVVYAQRTEREGETWAKKATGASNLTAEMNPRWNTSQFAGRFGLCLGASRW